MRMAQMSGNRQQGTGADEGQTMRKRPQPSLLGELQGKRSWEAGRRKEEIPQLPRTKDVTVMTAAELDYFKGQFLFTSNLTQVCKNTLIIPSHSSIHPKTPSRNPSEFGHI